MTNRAVSTTIGYALSLTVVTLLITGVFIGASGFVQDQREEAIRSELEVLGNRIAADLATVDRIATTVDAEKASVTTSLPERTAGRSYLVGIDPTGVPDTYAITLTTDDPSVEVTVRVKTSQPIATTTFTGGTIRIRYDGSDLEVDDA